MGHREKEKVGKAAGSHISFFILKQFHKLRCHSKCDSSVTGRRRDGKDLSGWTKAVWPPAIPQGFSSEMTAAGSAESLFYHLALSSH